MVNSKKSPLIVYVHVPKTAGSTVNKYMHEFSDIGISHCESIINIPAELKVAVAQNVWMSGHVPLPQFEKNIEAVCNRDVRYYSSVKDPIAQISSHYNWLIEIFHRSPDFYNNHPDHIKAISEKIRRTDNSIPKEIIKNLIQFSGLFLNCQSRIVIGDDFNWNEGHINERLNAYTFISTSKNIPKLLNKMTGNKPSITPRENVSLYHFDKEVFKAEEMGEFLLEQNFQDYTLHQAVLDKDRDCT